MTSADGFASYVSATCQIQWNSEHLTVQSMASFYWEMALLVFRRCMSCGNGNVEYHKLTQEISSQADMNAFNCSDLSLYPLSIYAHLWTQTSVPYGSNSLKQSSLTIAVLD